MEKQKVGFNRNLVNEYLSSCMDITVDILSYCDGIYTLDSSNHSRKVAALAFEFNARG